MILEQWVLLQIPTLIGTTTVATTSTLRQTYVVKLATSTGTFEPDEVITQATTGASGRVVEWDSDIKSYYITNKNSFKGYGTRRYQLVV